MAEITKIVLNKSSAVVYIDGKPHARLPKSLLARWPLEVGEDIDVDTWEGWLHEHVKSRAYERALTYLTGGAHTHREVENALKRYGYAPYTREKTLVRLINAGLISDADVAARYVELKRGYGAMRLKSAMKVKGISEEIIAETLSQRDATDEINSARSLAQKRAPRYAHLDVRKAEQKLVAYLSRRGFTYDVIRTALERDISEFYEEEL